MGVKRTLNGRVMRTFKLDEHTPAPWKEGDLIGIMFKAKSAGISLVNAYFVHDSLYVEIVEGDLGRFNALVREWRADKRKKVV